jgi:hypothetical protein
MPAVKILRSTTAGVVPTSLLSGQVAINEADQKLFWRDPTSGTVVSANLGDIATTKAALASVPSAAATNALILALG